MQKFVEIKIGERFFKFPIKESNLGPHVVDIKNFYKETGFFTYDPGFMSTASCNSDISYIDGEKSILLHRGYNITELAEKTTFLEVVFLLIYKKLPTKEEYLSFKTKILKASKVNTKLVKILKNFPSNAHSMHLLLTLFSALQLFPEDQNEEDSIIYIISQMLSISAMIYRHNTKNLNIEEMPSPIIEEDFAKNLLHMFFSTDSKKYHDVNNIFTDALNKVLILHIDHEQNASTSSVRMVGSSKASVFSAISAGIASLSGPLHGGANEKVLNMINQIGTSEKIDHFISKAKDPNDSFKLMGFGHRVYKNYDPRAKILKNILQSVINHSDNNNYNSKLQIAQKLEQIALEDKYFIDRKLYPNVDFYSGIIYEAIGIPINMFTVMFAIARTTGWLVHWKEMRNDPEFKIARPRQLYLGQKDQTLE
ncbi:MAG: citrate synthase [Rickettsia sp.]|nr:citrate synthase [Rickettsia sp.]